MEISGKTATVLSVPGRIGRVFSSTGEAHRDSPAASNDIGTRTKTLATMRRFLSGQPGVPREDGMAVMQFLQDLPTDSQDLRIEIAEICEKILVLEEELSGGNPN